MVLNGAIIYTLMGANCDAVVVGGFGVAEAIYKIFGISFPSAIAFSIQGTVG